jgi:hypothetical protein
MREAEFEIAGSLKFIGYHNKTVRIEHRNKFGLNQLFFETLLYRNYYDRLTLQLTLRVAGRLLIGGG